MARKFLVYWIAVSILIWQAAPVFSQSGDVEEIARNLQIQRKTAISEAEEGYKRFTCPSCGRDFELTVDPNDVELKKGVRQITCPYDGTMFYPTVYDAERYEGKFQYEAIRCPICGKEFKAYVNIKAILSGQPQTLVCPYDNKKFYFKAEQYRPRLLQAANFYTVMCPSDKRTFKAYIDSEDVRELTCPYDGTRFFPTPEHIISKIGSMAGGEIKQAPGQSPTAPSFTGAAMEDFTQPVYAPTGGIAGKRPSIRKKERSRIEQMFSEHIPLSVSTDISQFGYDVFEPKTSIPESEDKGQKGRGEEGRDEKNILKTLVSSAVGKELSGGAGGIEAGGEFTASTLFSDIPVVSDYVLGPGDTIVITFWGQVQSVMPLTVDPEGKILIPKTGPLYVWGKKFSEAEKLILENISRSFTNIQASVSMGRLRAIKVFVLGEGQRPGSYTISSLSNSFHALYAAGGPTKVGSMRRIKFARKGSPDMPIDLYNILLKGDNSQDYKLQANDTIFIPPIGDVVGAAGNVKRPAIYELNGPAKVSDIIEMAGGLSAVGYLHRIQLERIEGHRRKVVSDLEFDSLEGFKESRNNVMVQDGDLILVFPVTSLRHNFVSIEGSILRPGDYELKQDMRLKDLIDKAGGLLPGTYLERAEIARFRGDQTREIIAVNLAELIKESQEGNLPLKEWDVVTVYARNQVVPDVFVEINGAVNKPGKYQLTDNMKISDLIFRAGGLKKNAVMQNAELFRSFSEPEAKIFNIDLNKALSKDAAEEAGKYDLPLVQGDHLFVREDAAKGEKIVVALGGEFVYPGMYAVEKGMRLSDVIRRAGGFTRDAFLDGVVYARESVRTAQKSAVRNFIDSEQSAMLQEQSSLAIGLTGAQAESRNKLIEYRQKLLSKLAEADIQGRILIRINEDMRAFERSEYNIAVENNDSVFIPVRPATVQVTGNVYGAGAVTFSEGKGVDYYIARVGGLTKHADANRIFVIRANGETVSSFVKAVKIKRGDTIIAPEEFKYRTLPGLLFKDIVQVVYQAVLGAVVTAAAVNTL